MTRDLKYIRTENGFFVFSEPTMHSEVSAHGQIISAGFCKIVNDEAICWGESISLNVTSRPEDGELLTIQINRRFR